MAFVRWPGRAGIFEGPATDESACRFARPAILTELPLFDVELDPTCGIGTVTSMGC